MFSMNKLSTAKRVQIVKALVEGNSLRSTTRMEEYERRRNLSAGTPVDTVRVQPSGPRRFV